MMITIIMNTTMMAATTPAIMYTTYEGKPGEEREGRGRKGETERKDTGECKYEGR